METNQLIDELASSAEPVKPVKFRNIMAAWFTVSISFGLFYGWVIGFRPDIAVKMSEPFYLVALLVYLNSFIIASYYAFAVAVPGKSKLTFKGVLTILFINTLFALSLYSNMFQPETRIIYSSTPLEAISCCVLIALGTLLPCMAFTIFASRLAPIQYRQSLGFAWYASASLVSINSQLHCGINDIVHVFVGHGLLLAGVSTLAYFIIRPIAKILVNRQLNNALNKLDKTVTHRPIQ